MIDGRRRRSANLGPDLSNWIKNAGRTSAGCGTAKRKALADAARSVGRHWLQTALVPLRYEISVRFLCGCRNAVHRLYDQARAMPANLAERSHIFGAGRSQVRPAFELTVCVPGRRPKNRELKIATIADRIDPYYQEIDIRAKRHPRNPGRAASCLLERI
jgi:hypothetical protein